MTTEHLRDAEAAYKAASLRAEQLREQRNQAVWDALDAGLTHAVIAEATGLTRGRVGQLAIAKP